MGLLRVAIACGLVMFAASSSYASDSDLPHWKPNKKTIAKLDFAFRNSSDWHGTPPKFDDFYRYYAGVTIKGRRMIRAEFTVIPNNTRSAVHVVSEEQFPMIEDGGCGVVNMLYDVDSDRMVWLRCNGLA